MPQDARRWQRKTRRALELTLGFSNLPVAPLAPEQVESVDKGEYIREKWLLSTWEHAIMPVYLLIPKGEGPFPVTLAFHGHGYGVKEIVGLWEDGQERDVPDGYQADFAVALCKRGFLVAAPEISCFGERQTDFSYLNTTIGQEIPSTCDHASKLAFHLGGTVLGLRVHDVRRLVDYLETRPEADIHRLGAMGISGGGMLTFFTTCLEERIRACVISGYYSTFQDSILAMNHCTCNFVPGLGLFGEMYDLVGSDCSPPPDGRSRNLRPDLPARCSQRSVDIARKRVYRVFGAESQIALDIFEGRHRISGKLAYDFLYEKLGH